MIKKYNLFVTPACPNCLAVKEFLEGVKLEGEIIDATTPEGIKKAQEFQVTTVPTILFFDEDNKLVSTAHSIEEIKPIIENKSLIDL